MCTSLWAPSATGPAGTKGDSTALWWAFWTAGRSRWPANFSVTDLKALSPRLHPTVGWSTIAPNTCSKGPTDSSSLPALFSFHSAVARPVKKEMTKFTLFSSISKCWSLYNPHCIRKAQHWLGFLSKHSGMAIGITGAFCRRESGRGGVTTAPCFSCLTSKVSWSIWLQVFCNGTEDREQESVPRMGF